VSVATAAPPRARPSAGLLWSGVLSGGMLVGLGSFLYQWSQGLGQTGLTNTISWGMYIITFMFLVGVSAGGLIVAAGAELVDSHRFDKLTRLAVIVSGTAIAAAAISIIPDLGRPELVWKMFRQPHWTSPLIWDVLIITVYLTIAALDLWILTRPNKPGAMRRMAFVAASGGRARASITADLRVARRPSLLEHGLLAPMFISSALCRARRC
jgi:molybdopterin-containing oxidoreductase family membrane subunit